MTAVRRVARAAQRGAGVDLSASEVQRIQILIRAGMNALSTLQRINPPDHRAAMWGCTRTGEGASLEADSVVTMPDGSVRVFPWWAPLCWREVLPLDPDAPPGATVETREVFVPRCTAGEALDRGEARSDA